MIEGVLAFWLISAVKIDYTKSTEKSDIVPMTWLFPKGQDEAACKLLKTLEIDNDNEKTSTYHIAYIQYVEPRIVRRIDGVPMTVFTKTDVSCKKWTVDIPGRGGKEERVGVILP